MVTTRSRRKDQPWGFLRAAVVGSNCPFLIVFFCLVFLVSLIHYFTITLLFALHRRSSLINSFKSIIRIIIVIVLQPLGLFRFFQHPLPTNLHLFIPIFLLYTIHLNNIPPPLKLKTLFLFFSWIHMPSLPKPTTLSTTSTLDSTSDHSPNHWSHDCPHPL